MIQRLMFFRDLFCIKFPYAIKDEYVFGCAVIGIGQFPVAEAFVLIIQCYLGKDAPVDIDPVTEVLGGGEDELGHIDISRVDIDPTAAARREFFFQLVCPDFDAGKLGGVDKPLKTAEPARKAGSHFFLIMIGKREGYFPAFEIGFAESLFNPAFRFSVYFG